MIRRFRQRRGVKRELREEAVRLERRLEEQHSKLRVSAQRNKATLDALSEATPSCPSYGAKLAIKTAMVKGCNGRQFWGYSRHPRLRAGDHRARRLPARRLCGDHSQAGQDVKPVKLPPEAEAQLAEFRALADEAEEVVARQGQQLQEIAAEAVAEVARSQEVIQAMIDDKLVAAELVAEALADYETAIAGARADVLREKSRPARAAAEEIRAKGRQLSTLWREAKYTQYLLKLYEWHFPWLSELRDAEDARAFLADLTDHEGDDPQADPVKHWLTPEEFAKLSEGERNQRALDRYLKTRKSPWQLGRDYKR